MLLQAPPDDGRNALERAAMYICPVDGTYRKERLGAP